MMASFNIREAVGDDILQIAEMEKKIFSVPWTKDDIERSVSGDLYTVLVCLDEETEDIVGYVIFQTLYENSDLCLLAADKNHRRIHIGSRLLAAGLGEVKKRGAKKVFLEVRKSNIPAYSLYRKFGFTVTDTRKNYYTHPLEDGLVMMLEME